MTPLPRDPAPRCEPLAIAIIGLGRVGSALGQALHTAGYRIATISSRDAAKAASYARRWRATATDPLQATCTAELIFLAIPDDALVPVCADLATQGAWRSGQAVVHASGALPSHALQPAADAGAQIGAFHPLAAFAGPDMPLPAGITIAIEAQPPLETTLWTIADAIGARPLRITAEDKPLYHAAAVIASNYTVTLAAIATQILEHLGATGEQGLAAILPLLRTTLDNLEQQGLPAALTGPLVRGDVGTISRHLHALDQAAPELGEFYRCLAQGTLPLVQSRGLSTAAAGELHDRLTLPRELLPHHSDS